MSLFFLVRRRRPKPWSFAPPLSDQRSSLCGHRAEEDDEPNQMMLLSDMVLAWDPTFRSVLEEYAEDEELLKSDFGLAFQKLTELGCENVLQAAV